MTYSIAQDALTLAATGTLYTAIAYIAAGIFHQIWKTPAPQSVQESPKPEPKAPTVEETPSLPTPISKPALIRSAALAIPASALRIEEAPTPGTIRELRKRCTEAGIKGAARFTKAQCQAALG